MEDVLIWSTALLAATSFALLVTTWRYTATTRSIAESTKEAAQAAERSARTQRLTRHTDLVYRLLDEYGSERMHTALKALSDWQAKSKSIGIEKAADVWLAARNRREQWANELDRHRRTVTMLYHKALLLREQDLLPEALHSELLGLSGREVLFPIVAILEQRLSRELGTTVSYERFFDRLRRSFGGGVPGGPAPGVVLTSPCGTVPLQPRPKTGRPMTTDQLSTESETPDRRSETDRRLSARRVLRRVLPVGQRSAEDQRVSDRRTDD